MESYHPSQMADIQSLISMENEPSISQMENESSINQMKIDTIPLILSTSYDNLLDRLAKPAKPTDGDQTEYSEEDDDECITRLTKRQLKNDLSDLSYFHSIGYEFWDILERIRNDTTPIWIAKLNPNRHQFVDSLLMTLTKDEYCRPRSGHERQSLKLLHKQGIRFAELAGYFEKHDTRDANEDEIATQLKQDAETTASSTRLERFKSEMDLKTPWFIADSTTSVKRKRRNLRKINEWIYKDVDIDYGRDHDQDDNLYRLNVVKVNYGDYLYYSIRCNLPVLDDNKSDHVFAKITEADSWGEDEDLTESGGIVRDNEMTRMHFKWLAMPNSDMDTQIGNHFPLLYRQSILLLLQNVID
jgi:hypothetical protein